MFVQAGRRPPSRINQVDRSIARRDVMGVASRDSRAAAVGRPSVESGESLTAKDHGPTRWRGEGISVRPRG